MTSTRKRVALARVLAGLAALASASYASAALVVGNDILQGAAYTTYQEPGDGTFRIICQTPCPIPLATLQAASDGFRAAKVQLLALSGLDTLAMLQPVDMAFEGNSLCPYVPGASGYSSIYFPYGTAPGQPRRAKSCLFLWNYQQSGQITYFTPEQAGLLSSQTLAVHEYAHSIFYDRHRRSYEDFVRYWSYAITGNVPLPDGMCSENLVLYMAPMMYEVCQRYGADDADLRFALARLDQSYTQNLGYHGPTTSVAQLRAAYDERFGTYTGDLFFDLGYAPQHVGGVFQGDEISPGSGLYDFDIGLPGGQFHLEGISLFDGAVKLEQPTCLSDGQPFLDFNLAFDLVKPDHRENTNILFDPLFGSTQGMRVTYSFAHWTPPAGINPVNLRVFGMLGHCGQASPPMQWYALPDVNVTFDHVGKTVSFITGSGGTFALIQPDAVMTSGFE
jgi:hypothetical protein